MVASGLRVVHQLTSVEDMETTSCDAMKVTPQSTHRTGELVKPQKITESLVTMRVQNIAREAAAGRFAAVERILDGAKGSHALEALNDGSLYPDGTLPLHHAAARGDGMAVQALLARGADPTVVTPDGLDAKDLAAAKGFSLCADYLNQAKRDVVHDTLEACRAGIFHTCLLLRFRTSPHLVQARAAKAYTPLHFACTHGHLLAAQHLVALGADPTALTAHKETPAEVAGRHGHLGVASYLDHHEAKRRGDALADYVKSNAPDAVSGTLQGRCQDYHPDSTLDEEGNRLLHVAARLGDMETVRRCVQEAANPTLVNHKHETPADVAAHHGHPYVAGFLAGVAFNTPDVSPTRSLSTRYPFIGDDVVAIGDIHGHLDRLVALWQRLEAVDALQSRTVVFLGDYCDRGQDTKGTVQWLVDLKARRPETVFLCGNHDFGLATFLGLWTGTTGFRHTWDTPGAQDQPLWSGPDSTVVDNMHLQGRRWGADPSGFSSAPTFHSYGVPVGDREALLNAMPPSHLEFFRDLRFVAENRRHVFVHAGLEKEGILNDQLGRLYTRDLIKEPRPAPLFQRSLNAAHPDNPKVVVVGHVAVPSVQFLPHCIMVDTTGGRVDPSKRLALSAVLLPDLRVVTT